MIPKTGMGKQRKVTALINKSKDQTSSSDGKVSPNSSPKVSPDGQFGGGNGAMRSGEQAAQKAA
jgi:hypothetical protein